MTLWAPQVPKCCYDSWTGCLEIGYPSYLYTSNHNHQFPNIPRGYTMYYSSQKAQAYYRFNGRVIFHPLSLVFLLPCQIIRLSHHKHYDALVKLLGGALRNGSTHTIKP